MIRIFAAVMIATAGAAPPTRCRCSSAGRGGWACLPASPGCR